MLGGHRSKAKNREMSILLVDCDRVYIGWSKEHLPEVHLPVLIVFLFFLSPFARCIPPEYLFSV